MASISIRNLGKSYTGAEGAPAVSGLNIEVPDNRFLTLLGPSGCGKTTTLRLIAGFLTPDSGEIGVGGRVLSSPGHAVAPENRGMGMVFQNYAIWPHKTVYENVIFGLKLRKVSADEAKRRVGEALAQVNLSGYEHRFPNELSGGQQQRVALARSLVVAPDILLLDEPLSNLDAKLREHMRGELKQLQRRTGITFVYVTHDQAEALALSDQIAVIHGGLLQQLGSPEDVYNRPANRIVADFMGLTNLLAATVTAGSAGAITADVAGMAIEIPSATPFAPGADIDIVVRPENLEIAAPGTQGALAGRVSDRVFLGNIAEYYITIAAGGSLRIQTHPNAPYREGDNVAVKIAAQTCSAFARQPSAAKAA
ncbi:MAG: ABC transporter ATP-binding protein [Alphaproteobacteria bacterium]|nr:ABC transporter ATP-binding protein [Alphaproteobacteria bacterium]